MIARVRVVVDVQFPFTVDPPDDTGYSPSQAAASDYANTTVFPAVKNAVAAQGTVLDDHCLIEEIREDNQ